VADFPDRPIHGYRISQLFSSMVDPGEILSEYRTTRYPDRFFNLKIGIPWADLERRLDVASVLSLCSQSPLRESKRGDYHSMGVDTGRELHVVILRSADEDENQPRQLVHLEACHEFGELDGLLQRFSVRRCVIDGLPETHATREFAQRHRGQVFMNFFNEHQRGSPKWDSDGQIVQVNRTEALDASRAAVRERQVVLPPRSPLLDEFAAHMSSDAKVLEEDETTGIKKYRYIRTGTNHYSLAFTYAWLAVGSGLCMPSFTTLVFPQARDDDQEWERMFSPRMSDFFR
jgi:hypothetical protein